MDQRPSLSQRGIVHLLAIVIGLGLLVALAFSLNALFASRSQQQPQVARQAEVEKQPGTDSNVVEEPSSTPTVATRETGPMAEWRVYTNKVHKFLIKYPPGMEIKEYSVASKPNAGMSFTLLGPSQQANTELTEGIMGGIEVDTATNTSDVTQYFRELQQGNPRIILPSETHEEVQTRNGITGIKVTGEREGEVRVLQIKAYFPHPDGILRFFANTGSLSTQEYRRIVDQMLSTLELPSP